ncbi:MAG: DNA primase [Gammaproteobacteria bacterium]|nr:DNA primase [Gammaproteobacteria bacterium]
MSGRIPTQFIDELLTRVDIVEIIDSRIPLKKAGREYKACCPFHDEKTPSFTVSHTKQFYHCFGCGAHGSAVGFLMEYEHLAFIDAIEELASSAGVTVPREARSEQAQQFAGLYDILKQAGHFYTSQLKQHQNTEQAVQYLNKRGVSEEVATKFGIGYAPPGWENLLLHFESKQIAQQALLDAGLLIKRDGGGHYDRFRNRIVFPIRDRRGRIIGFGGRALGDDTPKYLNSPETAVFHKGRELYGLFEAAKSVRDLQQIIIVEGYMDVVSLSQFGICNVVATLGTATTAEHVEKLFRVTPELVFCFDGDRAGRQAAWRGLETVLPLMRDGRQIKFMFLPEGEDPDTIVRFEGRQGFDKRLKDGLPFSNFFYKTLSNNIELTSPDGRSLLFERAKPLLLKLPESVFRHMMVDELAEICQMNAEKLSTLIFSTKVISKQEPTTSRKLVRVQQKGEPPSLVRRAIRLLLESPGLAKSVDVSQIKGLNLPGVLLLIELVELVKTHHQISCGAIIEHWRGTPHGKHLAKLAQLPLNLPDEGVEVEFLDSIQCLFRERQAQRLDELFQKSELGVLDAEDKRELRELNAALPR